MKQLLLSTMLLYSSVFAYDIGVNLSYNHLQIKQTNSDNIILGDNTPKSNGLGVEVYYRGDCLLIDDASIKNYFSLKQTHTSNTDTYALLGGINKEFQYNTLTLYSGVLLGYGFLEYAYNPLSNSSVHDNRANSTLYGAQLGLKQPIYKNSYLQIEARYIRSDYDANLESSGILSQITQKDQSSLSIGYGYSF